MNAFRTDSRISAWRGGVVRKGDVTIAKNYLNAEEITELNRIVTMFLDFAEDQARKRKQVFMRDWRMRLDDFLKFNERKVLQDAGAVSLEKAERHAQEQYALFEERRRKELEARGEAEIGDALKALEEKAKKAVPPESQKK